jgi:DNA-directed RNA polymerase subunit beta'
MWVRLKRAMAAGQSGSSLQDFVRLKEVRPGCGRRRIHRENHPRRNHRRPCAAFQDPAGACPSRSSTSALKKKEISKLINESFRRCGLKETVVFADKLMQNGYVWRLALVSPSAVDDMRVPAKKHEIIAAAEAEVKEIAHPVHLRSGDQWRTLQQGRRYLGPYR